MVKLICTYVDERTDRNEIALMCPHQPLAVTNENVDF